MPASQHSTDGTGSTELQLDPQPTEVLAAPTSQIKIPWFDAKLSRDFLPQDKLHDGAFGLRENL